MPCESAHEDTKLKEHVVSQGYIPSASSLDDVVGLGDGDCEIRLVDSILKSFEGITTYEENTLAPDVAKNVSLQLRLYLARYFKGLRRGNDEQLWIFVWRSNEVVTLKESPGEFTRE